MGGLFCYYFDGIFEDKFGRRSIMHRKWLLTMVPALLVLAACLLFHQESNASERPYFKEDEIIISYRSDVPIDRIERIAASENTEIVYRSAFADFVTVRFDHRSMDRQQLIRKLKSYPEVSFAEPNGIAYLFWTPDDPYFQYQWNFDNTHLNMELAWDIERGGTSSVIVGILDTGVAFEDYAIPGHEVDSVTSADGYYHQSPDLATTYFVQGYDAINQDGHPNDMHGHGSHCAGTVAQSTDNNKGVAGMAFRVSIMPVRVLNSYGSGSCDQIADGINYAYQNGADVISMSLGGAPGDSVGFGVVHQAIINADNAGTVVIAAAGNSGSGELSYPAAFEECIAVGATDIDNTLAPYSQWGDGIDVVAPGGDLYDTIPGTNYAAGVLQSTYWFMNDGYGQLASVDSFGYTFLQGTSMATPHVAGLAALMISHGITGSSAIKSAIYNTCTDLGAAGYDLYYGHGLINPPMALDADVLFSSMPIIQNPYAQQYIDIWVVPQRPIYNDMPDTCRVALGGVDTYLNFEKVAERTYRTDFYFDESGTATIYVTGRDDTTMMKGTITRQFSVNAVYGMDGGIARSTDELFLLTVPSHQYGGTYWIVISESEFSPEDVPYLPLSRAYRCGPEGTSLAVSSVVQMAFDRSVLEEHSHEDIGIYRKTGDELVPVMTWIDPVNGLASAAITEFGTYVLVCWPGKGGSSSTADQVLTLSCYPNPARDVLGFAYLVPRGAFVDIALYDAAGRRIETIERSSKAFGLYTGTCDLSGAKLGAGVYFLRISARTELEVLSRSEKVILLK